MTSLASALSSLREGDAASALDVLLAVWRDTPTNAVADAIDALSNSITARLPPVTAVGKTSARKAWDQIVAERNSADLGRLLAVLPDDNKRGLRLRALAEWPRDPRIGTAALKWFAEPPVAGARRRSFFVPLIELLSKHPDPRLAPALAELTSADTRSRTIQRAGLHAWKPLVALAKAISSRESAVLPAEDEALLAQLRQRIATTQTKREEDPAELFARVYEHPDDDEARAVLGDLLQHNGDPRGEFIVLQLARGTGKRTPRERELEETWGRKWLGALEPALLAGGVVFERGFLARCRYMGATTGEATRGAIEWSTVSHVDASHASQYVSYSFRVLLDPVMRSLRHVTGLSRVDLTEIARAKPLPWQTIGARMWRFTDLEPLRLGPTEAFANVRTLVLEAASGPFIPNMVPDWLGALLARWPALRRLEMGLSPEVIAHLASVATMVPELVITSARDVTFERRDRTLRVVFSSLRYVDYVSGVVESLKGQFDQLEIAGAKPDGDALVRGKDRLSLVPFREVAGKLGVPLLVAP